MCLHDVEGKAVSHKNNTKYKEKKMSDDNKHQTFLQIASKVSNNDPEKTLACFLRIIAFCEKAKTKHGLDSSETDYIEMEKEITFVLKGSYSG